jgi:hypothetical protein
VETNLRGRVLIATLLLAGAPPATAGDLLRDVEACLGHARVTRGEFVQEKQLVGIERPLRGRGSFMVDRDRGVVWRNEAPFHSVLRITRREIVQTDGGQVLMHLEAEREPAVKAVSAVLFATFAADLDALSQYFTFEGKVDGGAWQLTLRPKDAALGHLIRSIELGGGREVRLVKMTAASGDLLHIEFRQVEAAAAPTAGEVAELD